MTSKTNGTSVGSSLESRETEEQATYDASEPAQNRIAPASFQDPIIISDSDSEDSDTPLIQTWRKRQQRRVAAADKRQARPRHLGLDSDALPEYPSVQYEKSQEKIIAKTPANLLGPESAAGSKRKRETLSSSTAPLPPKACESSSSPSAKAIVLKLKPAISLKVDSASQDGNGARISGSTPVTINITQVESQIKRLERVVLDSKKPFLDRKPAAHRFPETLPNADMFDPTLIYAPINVEGTRATGGLMRWLRSASVLPILKMWASECASDNKQAKLRAYLKPDAYPWKREHVHIAEPDKLPDGGKSKTDEFTDAVLSCAVYAKKLFLANRDYLSANGVGARFLWHGVYGVPVGVILAVHRDLTNKPKKSLFAKLLKTEIAQPMHADTRKLWDAQFVIPGGKFSLKDRTHFFVPKANVKRGKIRATVDSDVSSGDIEVDHDAFPDKEELALSLVVRAFGKETSTLDTLIAHVCEVLPGRDKEECRKYLEDHKNSLVVVQEREGRGKGLSKKFKQGPTIHDKKDGLTTAAEGERHNKGHAKRMKQALKGMEAERANRIVKYGPLARDAPLR